MARTKTTDFPSQSFSKRLNTMMKADGRRMFTSSMFYIMAGIALVMPILILCMTTMVGADPAAEAGMFTSVWQIIGSESGSMGMNMDMTTMCNINLMFFMAGIFLCLFVAEDFQSGYAKNLFTVRARKGDYIVSKTFYGFLAGAIFLLCFFVGALLGGAFSGLSFATGAAGAAGVMMCMLSKIFLLAVFIAIFLLMAVIGKQRSWLSILLALFGGMLMFMMIPAMTPIDAGIVHVGLTLAGGAIFAPCIGLISRLVLSRQDLV